MSEERFVIQGYLRYYQPRLFGSNWRDVFVTITRPSIFSIYGSNKCTTLKARVNLQRSAALLAIDRHTLEIPGRPKLPPHFSCDSLLAIGGEQLDDTLWVLFSDSNELQTWWKEIVRLLPPPPIPSMENPKKITWGTGSGFVAMLKSSEQYNEDKSGMLYMGTSGDCGAGAGGGDCGAGAGGGDCGGF